MECPSCSAAVPDGYRYCDKCGSSMDQRCPDCGTPVRREAKFCGRCGAALQPDISMQQPGHAPHVERRRVSILFADLVGFTPLSATRDPEDVRDLLSRYFEIARTVVSRYGGTIEKFIGDAVMSVWGVPVVHEDDAERSVRAALDLVEAVGNLGPEAGIPSLRVRAGVVSGEVAVNLDAVGQGMVAGDAVNTAARIQAAAEPGSVWVDDPTRASTRAAIAYEDRGEHSLKGKNEPMRLFEARRVVAGRSGAERTAGLEPPFVGRDRELRLVKELFHGCVERRTVRLVTLSGVAGVGKSRLLWEFKKYLDGIVTGVNWHSGRCLSYGEGIAYRPLAEVVRARLGIGDGDAAEDALQRLRDGLVRFVDSAEDREWLGPRLAALLGLADSTLEGAGPETLFPAWRLFIERVAAEDPAVLVFEDLHWADQGFLDFLDHLLEWSRGFPIFVVTLARPELDERRPEWSRQRRNVTPVYLEPLDEPAMRALVDGVAPQLPPAARAAVLERAEGIPLYAVEMLRMLVDQGLLVGGEDHYELASAGAETEALSIELPASLQALVSARLDSLELEERRTVQDAAVIGISFSDQDVAAVASARGRSPDETKSTLQALVRRDIFGVEAGPPSHEPGHYRFVQSVMRTVAYDSMARHDRKTRHLAVAAHFARVPEADELSPVIGRHYLDAAAAVPDASDADSLRALAREHLLRAAERAGSLGATSESITHYERLIGLLPAGDELAAIAERAAEAAFRGARYELALQHVALARQSISQPDAHARARLATLEGNVLMDVEQPRKALDTLEAAYSALADSPVDLVTARLVSAIATAHSRLGDDEHAMVWGERASVMAQNLGAWDVLADSVNSRGLGLIAAGRWVEALAMLRMALDLCVTHDLGPAALRPYINLAALSLTRNLKEAATYAEDGLALARRLGHRLRGELLLYHLLMARVMSGRWDEVEQSAEELEPAAGVPGIRDYLRWPVVLVRAFRGDSRAREIAIPEPAIPDAQAKLAHAAQMAEIAFMEGRMETSFAQASAAVEDAMAHTGIEDEFYVAWPLAVESAVLVGRLDDATDLLALVAVRPAGCVATYLQGQLARLRALIAAAREDGDDVGPDFALAARTLRAFGAPFWLARTLLDHGEWLVRRGDADDAAPLLGEALDIFTRLGAQPYAMRALVASGRAVAASSDADDRERAVAGRGAEG
jgi:class 3 adenylate cyclase/tetratricopeptide (TPR) repeat protein